MGEHTYEDHARFISWYTYMTYRKLTNPGFDKEDLMQEAYLIFLNAVETYNPERGKKKFLDYLQMKLNFGFKDFFRRQDHLPQTLSHRRTEPRFSRPISLESYLEIVEYGSTPTAFHTHDDLDAVDERIALDDFWTIYIAGLPHHHRVAFAVWRETGSQAEAARAAGVTPGRVCQLVKQMEQAARHYGKVTIG